MVAVGVIVPVFVAVPVFVVMAVPVVMVVFMIMAVAMVVFVVMVMVIVVFVVMTVAVLMVVVVPVVIVMPVLMPVMGLIPLRPVDVAVESVRPAAAGHVVAVLLLAVNRHVHVGVGDPAGAGLPGSHRHARYQAVHGLHKPVLVLQQLIQGGHQHVAGSPHPAFDI